MSSRIPTLPKIAELDARNQECARIILADSERCGGPDSLMVRWARVVIEKASASEGMRRAA